MRTASMRSFKNILLILIFLIFIFKLITAHPSFSDENVYFLMGKRIAEGMVPYKEFSFVHPPFQVYILSALFKIFGSTIAVGKLLPLIASSISVYLIFLIAENLYKEKVAFISTVLFLLTPAFIAFSDQGYGMWEPLLFLLLSVYLVLKNKTALSAIIFSVSFFFRYLTLIYFPFILVLIFLMKKNLKQFLFSFFLSFSVIFLILYIIFGYEFIDDTILYQMYARFTSSQLLKLSSQYFYFGFFSLFLGLISFLFALEKKDKLLLLFSAYPICADLLILLAFKTIIYHYFLFSLPFIIIAISKVFFASRDLIIRVSILVIIFLSITTNFRTIDFYQNPEYSKNFYYIAQYVQNRTSEADNIFGESSVTDYISFTTNISVTSNYLDSYLSYLIYISEEKVIQNLEKQKPKFIIDMENYYNSNPYFSRYLQEKYEFQEKVSGTPAYLIYARK